MRQLNRFLFISICLGTILVLSPVPPTLLAQDASSTGMHLEETAICRQIVDREPLGRGSVFDVGVGRLYCFTKVVGAKTDTTIIHHWYLNGKLKASVTLPVNSVAWRTWSSKDITLNDAGDWMVEVLAADGTALESILFLVQ